MRDSIENISQLQKKLNDLQLENQILKNILDKAGLSYHKELSKLRQSGSKEAFDPEQGKRIIHPQAITENMANQFLVCSGEDRMSMQSVVLIKKQERLHTIHSVIISGQMCVIRR